MARKLVLTALRLLAVVAAQPVAEAFKCLPEAEDGAATAPQIIPALELVPIVRLDGMDRPPVSRRFGMQR